MTSENQSTAMLTAIGASFSAPASLRWSFPAMTLLLSTSMNSPAIAQSVIVVHGKNGVGNGLDPQPPGNSADQ